MHSREIQIRGYLTRFGYENWNREALASDASSRRYFRLISPNGETVILMDAPPEMDCNTGNFVKIAETLSSHGFCAPKILSSDLDQGLLLISDLGQISLADALDRSPENSVSLLKNVCEIIVGLERLNVPNLSQMNPSLAGEMVGVSARCYANKPDVAAELSNIVQEIFMRHCANADCFSLRDLHVENVIWRDEQSPIESCGLLDFQDAFYAPQGYDLVSLLRDVRRDVPHKTVVEIQNHYVQLVKPDYDFDLRFACLSVQRNLRILGVLFKLVQNQRKFKYKPFITRTWRLLKIDLEHRSLTKLKKFVLAHFPEPDQAFLNSGSIK